MKLLWQNCLAGLFVWFLVSAFPCEADVIYSNLNSTLSGGGRDVLGSVAGSELNYMSQTAPQLFQSEATAAITNVIVGVLYPPGQPGFISVGGPSAVFSPNFNIWLYSDIEYKGSDGEGHPYDIHEPNAPISEVAQNLISPANAALVIAVPSSDSITLNAGTFYWMILTPANPYTFIAWSEVTGTYLESLQVDGNPVIPEPSTTGFLATGALAMICIERLRNRFSFRRRTT